MYRSFAAFVFCIMLAAIPSQSVAQQATTSGAFSIEHVTVIDVRNGSRAEDQTVVVDGNRIRAVGPAAIVRSPAGVRVVDGRGKFLIPGIWDMHVHILHNLPARTLPLFVAHGISGVREMGGGIDKLSEARRLMDDGLVAPRFIAAGPAVDGVPPSPNFPPGSDLYASSPEVGRQIVNRLIAQRVDFIKMHQQLPKETFLAMADEAKRWHIPFAGHLPVGMNIVEASDAGFRSIEHMAAFVPSCAANPDDLRRRDRNAPTPTTPIAINRAKCEEAARHVAKNGTWFTPTIGEPGRGDARTRAFNLAVLQIAFKSGVRLLAGTDGPGAGYWRGDYSGVNRTVQDEMAGMVEAGLTPLEALQTATVNPAAVFNMTDQLGSVDAGKLADLLLLDADPLMDIANTKRITAVVVSGRLIDAAMRQKLLDAEEAAEKANGKS